MAVSLLLTSSIAYFCWRGWMRAQQQIEDAHEAARDQHYSSGRYHDTQHYN